MGSAETDGVTAPIARLYPYNKDSQTYQFHATCLKGEIKIYTTFVLFSTNMKFLKKILFLLLSEHSYLRLMHRGFFFLYDLGFLKNDKSFKYHYKIKELIASDFTVVDIGANLGYFSKNFARLTPRGKVISIEPIPKFFLVLEKYISKYKNVQLYNVALGMEEGSITMVLPQSNGMLRTGLPHIVTDPKEANLHPTQEVQIIKGSSLLINQERLDYIKCDIEGYEWNVMQEIRPVLEKFNPYLQIEISPENRNQLIPFLKALGYIQFGLYNNQFTREDGQQKEEGDFFFVHSVNLENFSLSHKIN
jgi:FkbM family methyltransferase